MFMRQHSRQLFSGAAGLVWLSLCVAACGFTVSVAAQSQPSPPAQEEPIRILEASGIDRSVTEDNAGRRSPGYITGTVLDKTGAAAVGAQVELRQEDQSLNRNALSGDNGQFYYADVSPGPFQLIVTAEGFQTQKVSGSLHPGEAYIVPEIKLAVANVATEVEVRVSLTPVEVADDQIKAQEKQRVLGFIPNFYVSYVPDAVPLSSRQKFGLAWKSTSDPFTFVGVAAIAGVQHVTNDFEEYGQGAQGYAKRFGAAYADVVSGTFIGSAILPSLLKQDPRYFYKGTGNAPSRFLYALANTVICKGDDRRWQPNYSGIFGSFATGGISYLYYPKSDNAASQLVLQNSLIRIGETAFENVLQEFIIRRLTPRLQHHPQDPR